MLAINPDHPAHEWYFPPNWEQRAHTAWIVNRTVLFVKGLRTTTEIRRYDITEEVKVPTVVADMRKPPTPNNSRYIVADSADYWNALRDQARRHMETALDRYGAVMTATDEKIVQRMIKRWLRETAAS